VKGVCFLLKLSEEEPYKAVIDRKYPLDKIDEAFRYVEKGKKLEML